MDELKKAVSALNKGSSNSGTGSIIGIIKKISNSDISYHYIYGDSTNISTILNNYVYQVIDIYDGMLLVKYSYTTKFISDYIYIPGVTSLDFKQLIKRVDSKYEDTLISKNGIRIYITRNDLTSSCEYNITISGSDRIIELTIKSPSLFIQDTTDLNIDLKGTKYNIDFTSENIQAVGILTEIEYFKHILFGYFFNKYAGYQFEDKLYIGSNRKYDFIHYIKEYIKSIGQFTILNDIERLEDDMLIYLLASPYRLDVYCDKVIESGLNIDKNKLLMFSSLSKLYNLISITNTTIAPKKLNIKQVVTSWLNKTVNDNVNLYGLTRIIYNKSTSIMLNGECAYDDSIIAFAKEYINYIARASRDLSLITTPTVSFDAWAYSYAVYSGISRYLKTNKDGFNKAEEIADLMYHSKEFYGNILWYIVRKITDDDCVGFMYSESTCYLLVHYILVMPFYIKYHNEFAVHNVDMVVKRNCIANTFLDNTMM